MPFGRPWSMLARKSRRPGPLRAPLGRKWIGLPRPPAKSAERPLSRPPKPLSVLKDLGIGLNEIDPLANNFLDVLNKLRTGTFDYEGITTAFSSRVSPAIETIIDTSGAAVHLAESFKDAGAALAALTA